MQLLIAAQLAALLALAAAPGAAAWPCDRLDAVGPFLYSEDESVVLTFTQFSRGADSVVYNVSCAPPSGWSSATAVMPAPFTGFEIAFDESPPLSMPAALDASCTVISFFGESAPWCTRHSMESWACEPSCAKGSARSRASSITADRLRGCAHFTQY